jgi:NAD-dependent dihydropyrimidine dehydrogenase PreA subunit
MAVEDGIRWGDEGERRTVTVAAGAVVWSRRAGVGVRPDKCAGCGDVASVCVGRGDACLADGFVGW